MRQVTIYVPEGHKLPVPHNPTNHNNLSRFFLVHIMANLLDGSLWDLEKRSKIHKFMQKVLCFEEQLASITGVQYYVAYPDKIVLSIENKGSEEEITQKATRLLTQVFA